MGIKTLAVIFVIWLVAFCASCALCNGLKDDDE